MDTTRKNHYVPKWYQKRFLSSEKSAFHYLNLNPSLIKISNGTKLSKAIDWPCSPRQCFWEQDLYNTSYFGFIDDEIERRLFGEIDRTGAKAIDAMAAQDMRRMHATFEDFFEYIDGQRIRTPKGLAWLKSKYPNLTHNQLLMEMQRIRQMHCTLWVEAVREIVYADTSAVKFLVSDNPVTFYNHACNPDSEECRYPDDPRIEMKATQTIFPLDSNRCLILTNLDYARNPNLADPKAWRPNANPFRPTMGRIDTTICERHLQDHEVVAINYIIKSRAKQYIAAEKREWLEPEKIFKGDWKVAGKVLLPPKDELHHFGGEMYGQYEDGRYFYRDAYGRTHGEAEHLKKDPPKGKIGANHPCTCGSGKKYKKCCRDKAEEDRPSSSQRSIRERNLMFFSIVSKILGLEENNWTEVRRQLTDKKVVDVHKAVAALWPPDTDLMALLPRPDAKVSRALYSGLLDPRVTYKDIAALLPYVDEILLINPFLNPNVLQKKFNPIDNPAQFRYETLKNVLFLMPLMPLISAGRVNVIPDPLHFNPALRQQIWAEAEKRRGKVQIDEKMMKSNTEFAKDDFRRFIFSGPEDRIRRFVKKTNPDMTDVEMEKFLAYTRKQNEEDPLVLLDPATAQDGQGQVMVFHLNPNFELGMFLAQATGSFIVTSHPYRWSEICSSIDYFYSGAQSAWDPIAKYIMDFEMDFAHFSDQRDFVSMLNGGGFPDMKSALRNVWNMVQTERPVDASQIDGLLKDIDHGREKTKVSIDKLMQQKNDDQAEYLRVIKTKAKLSAKIAPAGHSTSLVYRQLLAHAGHDKYLKALPLALYIEHEEINEDGLAKQPEQAPS